MTLTIITNNNANSDNQINSNNSDKTLKYQKQLIKI